MLWRINKYIFDKIDKNKIDAKIRRNINCAIGYINVFRFTHQINNYTTETSRELFESSFIRYTYDKPDLTAEEVDQYIVMSAEVVIAANIQRRVERLQVLLDNAAQDSEGRRISMSLVESINTAQGEYHQSIARQHKLLGDLKEKRSDRLKNELKTNASILNLVQLWKEEESRKKMLYLAESRKRVVKEEVENLSSMDEMKSKILGLNEGDIFE